MRTVTLEKATGRLTGLSGEPITEPIAVENKNHLIGFLVSSEDYELIRKRRAQGLIDIFDKMGRQADLSEDEVKKLIASKD